jgi:hypothetical protein
MMPPLWAASFIREASLILEVVYLLERRAMMRFRPLALSQDRVQSSKQVN